MNPEQNGPTPQPQPQPMQQPEVTPQFQPPTSQVVQIEQPPKKSKSTVIFLVVLVLFLIGGAAFFFMRSDKKDNISTTSNNNESATNSKESALNDNLRMNDAARLAAAVNNYLANNNGKLPTLDQLDSTFVSGYLEKGFKDPSTDKQYVFVASDPKSGEMQYQTAASCDTNNGIVAGTKREAAIRIKLSDGGYRCVNS